MVTINSVGQGEKEKGREERRRKLKSGEINKCDG